MNERDPSRVARSYAFGQVVTSECPAVACSEPNGIADAAAAAWMFAGRRAIGRRSWS